VPPSSLSKDDVRSDLSVNHRNDSECAGIHDEDLIADQDVFRDIAGHIQGSKLARHKDALFLE
jgi:hypothetical protein